MALGAGTGGRPGKHGVAPEMLVSLGTLREGDSALVSPGAPSLPAVTPHLVECQGWGSGWTCGSDSRRGAAGPALLCAHRLPLEKPPGPAAGRDLPSAPRSLSEPRQRHPLGPRCFGQRVKLCLFTRARGSSQALGQTGGKGEDQKGTWGQARAGLCGSFWRSKPWRCRNGVDVPSPSLLNIPQSAL